MCVHIPFSWNDAGRSLRMLVLIHSNIIYLSPMWPFMSWPPWALPVCPSIRPSLCSLYPLFSHALSSDLTSSNFQMSHWRWIGSRRNTVDRMRGKATFQCLYIWSGDHVTDCQCLSLVSLFTCPRSLSAIAHVQSNPCPCSLGPVLDLLFHWDLNHYTFYPQTKKY